jgi:hypothetical protein
MSDHPALTARSAELSRRLRTGERKIHKTRVLTISGRDLVHAVRRGRGPARVVSRTKWGLPARPRRHRAGLAPRRVCERSRRPAGRRVQRIARSAADSDPPGEPAPAHGLRHVAGDSYLIDLFRCCARTRGVSPRAYGESVLDVWEDDDPRTLEHFCAIAAKAAAI